MKNRIPFADEKKFGRLSRESDPISFYYIGRLSWVDL